MTLPKYTLLLSLTLTFYCSLFGAALPEPTAARVQQVGYLAMVHQHILNATPLDNNTAKICAEYANGFPFIRPSRTYQDTFVKERELSVTCLAPIGQRCLLVNHNDNGSLRVVDMEAQKIAAISSPRSSPIHAVAYLPPFTVATLSTGATLRIWDIRNGKILRRVRDRFHATHLAPFGKTKVVTAEYDKIVFYDLESPRVDVHTCGGNVHSLFVLKENLCVAAGLHNGKIHVNDGVGNWTINASEAPIISLGNVSQDKLVSLDRNSNIAIWDIATGEILWSANIPSMHQLITCGNEVIGLPNLPEKNGLWGGSTPPKDSGKLSRILKVAPKEFLCEQQDLPLHQWYARTNVVCSTGNSFAWLTARLNTDDTSRPYGSPYNNALHTLKFDGSAEEKLDPEVQAWLDAKMNQKKMPVKKSSCAIS